MTKRRRIDGKQGRCCLLWLALVLVLAAGAGPGFAATIMADSSETDMSGYARPYHHGVEPVSPDSFWHDYLEQPFEDGLSPKDRSLSRARQEAGDCETVLTLELKGFLKLYPALSARLIDPGTKRQFESRIVPVHSPAYRRCLAYKNLTAITESEKRRWNLDRAYIAGLPQVFEVIRKDEPRPLRTIRLERAAMTLLALAVCERYLPAFDDSIHMQTRLEILHIAGDEMLHFHRLAKRAGIEDPTLDRLAGEAFRDFRSARVRVMAGGGTYLLVGPGGFVMPDRFKMMCETY